MFVTKNCGAASFVNKNYHSVVNVRDDLGISDISDCQPRPGPFAMIRVKDSRKIRYSNQFTFTYLISLHDLILPA